MGPNPSTLLLIDKGHLDTDRRRAVALVPSGGRRRWGQGRGWARRWGNEHNGEGRSAPARARTSWAPTGSGWRTRQARRRWRGCRGGIQRRWRGCAAGRTWCRWLRLRGTMCRLRLESEEKLRPEILGAGPGILISGPRFVGSAGDALTPSPILPLPIHDAEPSEYLCICYSCLTLWALDRRLFNEMSYPMSSPTPCSSPRTRAPRDLPLHLEPELHLLQRYSRGLISSPTVHSRLWLHRFFCCIGFHYFTVERCSCGDYWCKIFLKFTSNCNKVWLVKRVK
jgi:hypothetical protein